MSVFSASIFSRSACRFSSSCWYSAALSIRIAVALFWIWLRSFWQDTTIPVGMCVIRTAESVLLTCWPPFPPARKVSIRRSFSLISISIVSSTTGYTKTLANGYAAATGRQGRDPNQPVHLFRLQVPVCVLAPDLQRGALDPSLFAVLQIEQLHLVAVVLRPAGVHPHEHLGPVLRLRAAGARMDREQRIPRVVRPAQHVAELEPLHFMAKGLDLGPPLFLHRRIGVEGEELAQLSEFLRLLGRRIPRLDPPLQLLDLGDNAPRGRAVVPETRLGHPLLQFLETASLRGYVKDSLRVTRSASGNLAPAPASDSSCIPPILTRGAVLTDGPDEFSDT